MGLVGQCTIQRWCDLYCRRAHWHHMRFSQWVSGNRHRYIGHWGVSDVRLPAIPGNNRDYNFIGCSLLVERNRAMEKDQKRLHEIVKLVKH